ncbi:hypothetical protein NC652_024315 [Populus alba x Populus x berolinensis]|nr:hypothetical protein NC652_024315 [Populus alba x Populus x berolinensis]
METYMHSSLCPVVFLVIAKKCFGMSIVTQTNGVDHTIRIYSCASCRKDEDNAFVKGKSTNATRVLLYINAAV